MLPSIHRILAITVCALLGSNADLQGQSNTLFFRADDVDLETLVAQQREKSEPADMVGMEMGEQQPDGFVFRFL